MYRDLGGSCVKKGFSKDDALFCGSGGESSISVLKGRDTCVSFA